MKYLNRVVAIGASSGGVKAISQLFADIPKDIQMAFLVVIHTSFETPQFLHKVLKNKTSLEIVNLESETSIVPGTIYIAKPNFHMMVEDDRIKAIKGPRENLFRPAIDVLFRSLAVSFGSRSIGVLLTGRLNDGTSGLEAIQKCGGTTIIQNPKTAAFSEMPQTANEKIKVDYVLDIEEICAVLEKLNAEKISPQGLIPEYLKKENNIVKKIGSNIPLENDLGEQVPISCPSCSGPLWKLDNTEIKRYRCHVGHSFTEEALLESQNESLEEALWISLRTLEEKKMLLERMSKDYSNGKRALAYRSNRDKIEEVAEHISKLRNILQLTN